MNRSVVAFAALAAVGASSAAQASVTLQFSSGFTLPHTESGFQITSGNPGWSIASTRLVGQTGTVVQTMTSTLSQVGGLPFDLLSINTIFFFQGNTGDTLRVTSSNFAFIDLVNGFNTPTFSGPGWTGITSVTFQLTSSTTTSASGQFDDIVLNPAPAPGAAGLLLLGACARRRRR